MILRLLSHYWTADDHPATREAQVEDWLEDLIEFDLDVVRDACAEWRRRDENKRPTPGQIRKICFDEQQERRTTSQRSLESQQDGGTWPSWLYDIWGPASTGRIERQKALDMQQERYARAQAYRDGKLAEFDAAPAIPPATTGFRFTDEEIRTRLEWARVKGYQTWNDFLDAVQAGKESVVPYLENWKANHPGPQPVAGFKTARDLGVTSTPRSPLASYPDDPT